MWEKAAHHPVDGFVVPNGSEDDAAIARDEGCDTEIERQLHPLSLGVYRVVIQHAKSRPNVSQTATMLGCSSRHLQRMFEAALLPPPQRLVTIARWIPIARQLASEIDAPRTLAAQLRFSSPQAFYRAARRELGFGISELREAGAAERLLRDVVTAYQPLFTNEEDLAKLG